MREVAIRWASILAALVTGSLGSRAVAQEAPRENPRPHRFFDSPVDFWQRGAKQAPADTTREEIAPPGRSDAKRTNKDSGDWGYPVKLPNGQTSYQSLPERLVEVLEDPTPEKVQAYFEWRLKRTAKILRAAEAIKSYRRELVGTTGGQEASPVTEEGSREPEGPSPGLVTPSQETSGSSVRMLYFHKKNCPHCDTQDKILTKWLGRNPEIQLQVLEFGERPELWQKHRVRGTPTIVVENPSGATPTVLEGLADERRLDFAVAGSRPERTKGEAWARLKGE